MLESIIRSFCISIDNVIYGAITDVYDLLLLISRTSILSQADITLFTNRIYELLAIFMIFKVTLSLITYVVNPDSFTEKGKGIGPLVRNIIISLSLLVLSPYIFNMAFELQTYILEGNTIPKLIFGQDDTGDIINSAGEEMAFITMNAFVNPNSAISGMESCTTLYIDGKVNPACSGVNYDESTGTIDTNSESDKGMLSVVDEGKKYMVYNYVAGINNENYNLAFREDLVTQRTSEKEFIMNYSKLLSTAVGIVILLILVTFCMDIAVRSLKLSFYQMISPIPIISYIDPNGGKDGMFKKWYKACFSTYLSLFLRLFVIYFAIYLIDMVGRVSFVDIITGEALDSKLLKVFIIIGVLMFAKQLPKILEGLGLKIDGSGFTLNPLKKFENEALGGKRIKGTLGGIAGGAVAGALGGSHGDNVAKRLMTGAFAAGSGALRGGLHGKGYFGAKNMQADVNRKLREGRMQGMGSIKSRAYATLSRYGGEKMFIEGEGTELNERRELYDKEMQRVEEETSPLKLNKRKLQNSIAPHKQKIASANAVKSAADGILNFANSEVDKNKAGITSKKKGLYAAELNQMRGKEIAETDLTYHYLGQNGSIETKTIKAGDKITASDISASESFQGYYSKQAKLEYTDILIKGSEGKKAVVKADGSDYERDSTGTIIYEDMTADEIQKWQEKHQDFSAELVKYETICEVNSEQTGTNAMKTAKEIDDQSGNMGNLVTITQASIAKTEQEIANIDDQIMEKEVGAVIKYKGVEQNPEEFKADLDRDQNQFDAKSKLIDRGVSMGNAGRIMPPPPGGGK